MIGIVCAFFHTEGKGFYSKLLKILLPCIAIAIISIIVISYMASKKIIVQEAKNLLY